MTSVPVIAIFDIGKTNKKFFLIDEAYNIVKEESIQLKEITDEDGDSCEDINLLSQWVVDTLTAFLHSKDYNIKAINFSAYGASLVYVDKKGKPLAPLYNYLKSYPEELKNELYNKYSAEKISRETASPVLDSLNSGMQLYRIMKEKADLYKQIEYALHLPQYISYLITQTSCSDITSIGCHTQLWDFNRNDYHEWVIKEGIDKKLAPILPSDKAIDIRFADKKIKSGIGLHDSSCALIPYLTIFKEPFVLISTGTWCISLNPFNHTPPTNDELKKDCLCYLDYHSEQVKASRLFAGSEHEQQIKKIAKHFNQSIDFYKNIKYNDSIVAELKKSYSFNQNPDVGINESEFNNRHLTEFHNYEEAYHCLVLDIIHQQQLSTQLIIHNTNVNRIFVDGGFSNNSVYMHLLASVFPDLGVYAASVAQATAMGAALAIHKEWNSLSFPADMVKLKYYKANALTVNV